MYKLFIRPFLFLLPAEAAHDFTLFSTRYCKGPMKFLVKRLFQFKDPRLEQDLLGLHFESPIGLAAGLDKYAKALHFWPLLGVGHVEVGGVTPEPQAGNPKPRVFRLKKDQAIINRFGLNNDGVTVLNQKLKSRPKDLPLGVNIAKNEWTQNEEAVNDYVRCLEGIHENVDFLVMNVSCPNSTDVEELQNKKFLKTLLSAVKSANDALATPKPLLVKIGPDVNDRELDDILEIAMELKMDGIIATNTSAGREGLTTDAKTVENIGRGGLSGQVIRDAATDVIRKVAQKTGGKMLIIGVGGIASAEQAYEKIRAGASLVQLYTGLIYEGPGLIKRINKGLVKLLEKDGFTSVKEAIGADLQS